MNINDKLGATVLCDPRMHVLEVLETEHGHQGDDPSLRSRLGRRLGFGDNAVEVKQSLYDATRKYVWDADIHLMSVTTEGHGEAQRSEMGSESKNTAKITPHNAVDEAPSKTTTTRFVYDALHRRVGRVKDDGEVTVFVYEGWNVIAEKTVRRAVAGDGEKVELGTRYVWGEDLSGTLQGAGGIGGLLSSVQDGGPTEKGPQKVSSFFHYDSNGNVILLTDGLGRETGRYAYDAFGKTLTATGPAARMNRYRFSTKPVEEETGLVYYGFRYYDPVTGRWPSRDPIGEKGGVNVYAVVANGVVSKIDFLGMVMTKAQCQSAVQQALGSALALRIMAELGEQNRNGRDSSCRVPTFTCEECAYSCAVKGKPVSGLFDPSSGNIKICHDAPTQTASGVVDTIEHELVHALDTCDGCDWSECDHRACSEIRAYAAGNGLTGQTLKDAAANSVRSAPACEQNAMTHVNNVFDRCSNADPFGGYDGP